MNRREEVFYKCLGRKIAKARTEQNLTQEAVAEMCKCSRAQIANIERGRFAMAVHVLVKLEEVLRMRMTVYKIKGKKK